MANEHQEMEVEIDNPDDPRFDKIKCTTGATDQGDVITADTECTFHKSDE